ncbi:MAG TPA: hypothetical protein P5320_03820 [Bacteroidales bacterium]|nr:hypothetical protein [Bacteroidales bacterium]HOK73880.1 hypothetical protein [Bacteroidales bacterium]HOM39612.1 hypothetical protein [Bacteroidales bacterium]HPP91640.1 hypothetical protein [Bacteroidales bacterium]HQG56832.1 hypothetical protein [Bacteroidales bacterium]
MTTKRAILLTGLLLTIFIVFLLTDSEHKKNIIIPSENTPDNDSIFPENWFVSKIIDVTPGKLLCITSCNNGNIAAGGDSFIMMYDSEFNILWVKITELPVTALCAGDDLIFAAVRESVLLFDYQGNISGEWDLYMPGSYFTCISSNNKYVVLADAANKSVIITDKNGAARYVINGETGSFIIPSLYFDAHIDSSDLLYIANTGRKRIEKRRLDGTIIKWFGDSGSDADSFSGCCNPSHFVLYDNGYITSEKGINRIKILDENGKFVEFVSNKNSFAPGVPLDIYVARKDLVYGANPYDSKIYVFNRKQINTFNQAGI